MGKLLYHSPYATKWWMPNLFQVSKECIEFVYPDVEDDKRGVWGGELRGERRGGFQQPIYSTAQMLRIFSC